MKLPRTLSRAGMEATAFDKTGLGLPPRDMNRYLRILEEKGVLRFREGYASLTPAFEDLFVISVESLRGWYTPSIIDKPETLVAQEMARLVLDVTQSKVERGLMNREEIRNLANLIMEFLRYRRTDQRSELAELLRREM